MAHFARVFADQFEANIPDMSREAYEGLKEIGFTCLLERLDDGRPIADLHHARLSLDSVHAHHKLAGRMFLRRTPPRHLTLTSPLSPDRSFGSGVSSSANPRTPQRTRPFF